MNPSLRLRFLASLSTLGVAVVLLALPGRTRAEPPLGEKYALLVGVRQYDRTELRDLPYAEPDVEALADVLRKAGYQRVVLMTQTEGAKQARFLPLAANIRKTLKGLLQDRTADDSVVIAFAGHGVQFKGEDESYFCPMDAKLAEKETLVSMSEVYKDLEGSAAGTRLLLVDACRNDPRSDEARAASRVKLESVTRPQKALPPGGVAAFFSCSAGEKAFESGDLKHGVFFHFIIEGLRGKADLDGDGQIDLDELVRYTKKRVPDFVKEVYGDDVRQMPELVGKTRGLVALARVPAGGPDAAADKGKPGDASEPPRLDAYRAGRRVFGRWAKDGYWYPGTVKEVKDHKYLVRFDDDDRAWLEPGELVGYLPTVGDPVEADWLGKGKFYQGTVTQRDGENVHILYDDGDSEDTTISYLRADYDGLLRPNP